MSVQEIADELWHAGWIFVPVILAAVVAIIYLFTLLRSDPGNRR